MNSQNSPSEAILYLKIPILALGSGGGIPISSEMNVREHWSVGATRHKFQKKFIKTKLLASGIKIPLPVEIHLTRIAPRAYDQDNWVTACKYIVDAICEYIRPGLAPGRADDTDQIQISYAQRKAGPKEKFVEIEIFPLIVKEFVDKKESSDFPYVLTPGDGERLQPHPQLVGDATCPS